MNGTTSSSLDNLAGGAESSLSDASSLRELARSCVSQGDYKAASQYYEQLTQTQKDDPNIWRVLGLCYFLSGDYQSCFIAYQQGLQTPTGSSHPWLWYSLGLLYSKFENYEQAEQAFLKVLALQPCSDYNVFFRLGLVYTATGNLEAARDCFYECFESRGCPVESKPEILRRIGSCCQRQGNMVTATDYYTEALSFDQGNFKTLEYLGWVHYLEAEFEEALCCFTQALLCVGDDSAEAADLFYLVGMCHLKQRSYSEAQDALQQAIYKNPNTSIYWNSVGILYATVLQVKDAFDCLMKAATLQPVSAQVWFNTGVLYELCNQKSHAVLAYKRAYTLDTQMVTALSRQTCLESDLSQDNLPEFIHPAFEVLEIPFSKAARRLTRQVCQLPDATQCNSGYSWPVLTLCDPELSEHPSEECDAARLLEEYALVQRFNAMHGVRHQQMNTPPQSEDFPTTSGHVEHAFERRT